MTIFYDRQAVLVTDQLLVIDDRIYLIHAIEDVRVGPRKINDGVRLTAMLTPVPLVGVGFAVAVGGVFLMVFALLSLALALSAVVAVALVQARPHKFELWIRYDREMHLVFETREEWRIHQLARALRRAVDLSRRATSY